MATWPTCNIIIPIRGVTYHQECVRSLREGDALVFTREPDNPNDEFAIRVTTEDGSMIGYVPSFLAKRMSLSGGHVWGGRVDDLLRGNVWGVRATVFPADEGVQVSSAAVEDVDLSDSAEVEGDGRWVVARSGRVLGRVLSETGKSVVVSNPDSGSVLRYPLSVVRVVDGSEV